MKAPLTYSEHQRVMDMRDNFLRTIDMLLPSVSATYDDKLEHMFSVLSTNARIPIDRVKELDSTCTGHVDYAEKFSLRLACEYFGLN